MCPPRDISRADTQVSPYTFPVRLPPCYLCREDQAAGGDPKVGRPGGKGGQLTAGWVTAQGKTCVQPAGG